MIKRQTLLIVYYNTLEYHSLAENGKTHATDSAYVVQKRRQQRQR